MQIEETADILSLASAMYEGLSTGDIEEIEKTALGGAADVTSNYTVNAIKAIKTVADPVY